MRRSATGFAAALLLLVVALGVLFDRTWRLGEVFSPADLLDSAYPWAYEGPRREPANPTRSDEAFYHQPLMVTHWARLTRGDLPEWDPMVLAGVPAFHQGLDVARAFSPLSAPFYFLPPDIAVTVYAPLRLLCAALLMWLYLWHAGLSPPARATGAAAFALSGAFVVWLSAPMPTVALWLPLVALAVERLARDPRPRHAALLGVALGMQFLGGYLPTSLVVLAVTGIWAAGWILVPPRRSSAAGATPRVFAGPRTIAALGVGITAGVALAAAALWPMIVTLLGSPARGRSMHAFTLPWQNLATFALPDFWGTPLARNWWYPASGNYPELVTHLGVVTLVLAAIGGAWAVVSRDRRAVLAAIVALVALMQMYGWPPVSWASSLPGFRQMNPYRWNVALAFATAMLAGTGIDAARRAGLRRVLPAAVAVVLLGAVSAAALASELGTIRALNLQAFEKAQLARFAGFAGAGLLVSWWMARRGAHPFAAWLAAALVAAELVYAGHGFNPTLPRDRLYPATPGLAFLRAGIGQGRIAPVGASSRLVEGHVWGVYGLPAITGFDYFGDGRYQSFIARAAGRPEGPARWAYVGLDEATTPDLRLLGLLGTTFLVTPPLDASTAAGGYTDVGELVDGRHVSQAFVATHDGLRRVDLLAATHARRNEGTWEIVLRHGTREVGRWRIDAASLRDLDWLPLEFRAEDASQGQGYAIEIHASGARAGRAATLLATPGGGLDGGTLAVDGHDDPRALWIRTFATAPDRFPGAALAWAEDLNVYRNPFARPRAWFVDRIQVAPADRHLDALVAGTFDPARVVLVDPAVALASAPAPALVRRIDTSRDDRVDLDVDAPSGGVVVFAERFDPHWTLRTADGRELPLARADAVLMAAAVPPGTQHLTLEYSPRDWTLALWVSALSVLGIIVAWVRG